MPRQTRAIVPPSLNCVSQAYDSSMYRLSPPVSSSFFISSMQMHTESLVSRPPSHVNRISEEERWTILRAKEIYDASARRLESSVSDTAIKKHIRTHRMRYVFVWIFLAMNGLQHPLADYSSRIREVIVNAGKKAPPQISSELVQVYDAQYAKFLASSSSCSIPATVSSLQLTCCIDVVFDEDTRTYRGSLATSGYQDPMLRTAPFLLKVRVYGKCIDELRLLVQSPWTLERCGRSTGFLRGNYVGAADVRVEKSSENYGRRHEMAIPTVLTELLKNNEPADVKLHMYLELHCLSVFLNQVSQYAFEGFRPVTRIHLICQFSKSISHIVKSPTEGGRAEQSAKADRGPTPNMQSGFKPVSTTLGLAQTTEMASIRFPQGVCLPPPVTAIWGDSSTGAISNTSASAAYSLSNGPHQLPFYHRQEYFDIPHSPSIAFHGSRDQHTSIEGEGRLLSHNTHCPSYPAQDSVHDPGVDFASTSFDISSVPFDPSSGAFAGSFLGLAPDVTRPPILGEDCQRPSSTTGWNAIDETLAIDRPTWTYMNRLAPAPAALQASPYVEYSGCIFAQRPQQGPGHAYAVSTEDNDLLPDYICLVEDVHVSPSPTRSYEEIEDGMRASGAVSSVPWGEHAVARYLASGGANGWICNDALDRDSSQMQSDRVYIGNHNMGSFH